MRQMTDISMSILDLPGFQLNHAWFSTGYLPKGKMRLKLLRLGPNRCEMSHGYWHLTGAIVNFHDFGTWCHVLWAALWHLFYRGYVSFCGIQRHPLGKRERLQLSTASTILGSRGARMSESKWIPSEETRLLFSKQRVPVFSKDLSILIGFSVSWGLRQGSRYFCTCSETDNWSDNWSKHRSYQRISWISQLYFQKLTKNLFP